MNPAEEYRQQAADCDSEELELRRIEKAAHSRLLRLRSAVSDSITVKAAESIWAKAAAAVRDYQAKKSSP